MSSKTPDSANARRNAVVTWLNNGLILAFGITTGTIWTYLMFFREYSIDVQQQQQLAAEIESQLAENSDLIQRETLDLAAEVAPAYRAAVIRQIKQDYPRYVEVLNEQGGVYLANVEQQFIEQVKAQYREYLQTHRQVLADEFPNEADEESLDRLIAEFEHTLDALVERYYLDEFRRESKQTIALWQQFEPLPPSPADQPTLEDQLAQYISDWAMLSVTDETREQLDLE